MKFERVCPSTINTETHPHLAGVTKIWIIDDEFEVLYDEPQNAAKRTFRHLRVRRLDDKPIHDFMKLQEIKNEVWGEETIAVEVFPTQSHFRDGSNTYHLWTWAWVEREVPDLANLYNYREGVE